jgi:DNA (cytosine-5)-methyltransferase 1
MYMDYSKLWKLLIDKGMTKTDLMDLTGISSRVLAKLSKNETVTTDTLTRICAALNCNVSDIMDCVSEEHLSFYSAFKKLATCTEKNDRYKTLRFSVGEKKYVVYQSQQRANNNTEIQCGQRGHVMWKQNYPIGYITGNCEVDLLIAPPRTPDETVIVLITGKPSVIKGLDENGYVSSRGTPKTPTDVFVMSEAAFKLFTPPQDI